MPKGKPNMNPDELAALYAAGALAHDERVAFEALLANAESAHAMAWSAISPVVEALVESVPPKEPPPAVRASLLERIVSERSVTKSFYFQRESESDWADIGIAGARMRMLFVDKQRKVKTFLLRMDAGCEIPSHPHGEAEECYILEGDLHTADTVLRPGDYMRAPAGTMHGRSFTESGCLMLVTAGLDEHELN